MKFFPLSLTFFGQLVLRKLNSHYLSLSNTLIWLPFQQSYCLFLWWVLMAQTQYRNIDKGCEEILPQGKGLHHSQKLRKTVVIYKTSKLILSNKYLKKVPEKNIETRKKVPYSKSSCSKLIFFNQPTTYSMFLVLLWAIIITEERTHRA